MALLTINGIFRIAAKARSRLRGWLAMSEIRALHEVSYHKVVDLIATNLCWICLWCRRLTKSEHWVNNWLQLLQAKEIFAVGGKCQEC